MRLLLAAVFAALPALAEEPPQYRLKEDSHGIGSRIPRSVASWNIPLDKRYGEFTPEERERLHAYHPGLKPGDEPPYPARGLKPILREVADIQQRAQERGEATYGVRVDASGRAQAIAVYKSPDDRFTRAVAYHLINADYKPAKCGGTPCEGEYVFRFTFGVTP